VQGNNGILEIEIETHKCSMAKQEICKSKRFLSPYLSTKSFVPPSIYTLIYNIINFGSMLMNITKEDQE
jgi:hypothetical protein